MFQSEFSEFAKDDDTGESSLWKDTISNSLVRLNGIPVNPHAVLVRGSTSSDTTTGDSIRTESDSPIADRMLQTAKPAYGQRVVVSEIYQ